MGDDHSRIDLGKLSRLAEAGELYQVSDKITATALVPAVFVLWSGGSKGLAVRLISARVNTDTTIDIAFVGLLANPALAAGNTIGNLRLGGGSSQAFTEAAAIAAAAFSGVFVTGTIIPGGYAELLSPGGIYLPPNTGVMVFSVTAAATISTTWLWAECPRE